MRIYCSRAARQMPIGTTTETIRRTGASEGIRTLDTHVGNVMLYQAELRSLPESGEDYRSPQNLQDRIQAGSLEPPNTERITLSKSSWSMGL